MASSLTGCVSGIGTYVFSNEKSHYWSTTVLLMVMWKNSNEVVKLPSNTTSLIRIIRALKAYCHHEIRARIINAIEDGCNDSSRNANTIEKRLSVLDALHILAGSWNKVTKETIRSCLRKANFISAPGKQVLEFETPIPVPEKWLD